VSTIPAGQETSPPSGEDASARARRLDPSQYVVYIGFLLIFAVFAVVLRDDGFLTTSNLLNIVQQTAPVTVMAVATVFVLTAGQIDLSIGSVVGFSALVCAFLMRDWPWPVAALAGLMTGVVIGAINGAFVVLLRLPSFLVTLATMAVFSGVSQMISDLKSIPVERGWFTILFGAGSVFGIPSLVVWSAAAVAAGHFVYRETPIGAHVLAAGDNQRAARAAGIKVSRLKFGVLVLSSAAAALAGLLYCGRLYGARYTLGETDLLTVIAAVIIGGTRLSGGAGTVVGALIGSLLMGLLNNGLILMGLTVSEQLIVRGLIILAAVALTLREERPN
jgi:ribose transport system permease protein